MNSPLLALTAFGATAPWWTAPLLLATRLSNTSSLNDYASEPPPTPPRVSIVLPARNEATHITECVRSIADSTWPDLELIVVDDHSTDGTGDLARSIAAESPRMSIRVINAPDLPAGWFGKQWACESGAAVATGSLLLFTDADTRHAPDLVARLVSARARRGAELMSVAGRQDMHTVWERAVQPSVFSMILLRYGGTDALESAKHETDVIANGQCFMISRTAYDAVGRHRAVKSFVAEDVMMAQTVWRAGGRVSLVLGVTQLRTRMYDSLPALLRGWGKNVYAGGRFAMRGGTLGRALYPVLLPLFPLLMFLPFVTLSVAGVQWLRGNSDMMWWTLSSALATIGVLGTFAVANHMNRDPLRRALLAPLGALVLFFICVAAVVRGRRVSWKDRQYNAA